MTTKDPRNIVFVVFDTLRKDGIQPYGTRVSTPTFEHMATKGIYLDNVVSTSNWTIPSHVSFFTGKYPHEHGVHFWDSLKNQRSSMTLNSYREKVLPEIVRENGYNTIAFSSNPVVDRLTGFDRGFDNFYQTWPIYLDDLRDEIRKIVKDSGSELQTEQIDDTAIALDMIKRGRLAEFSKLLGVYFKILRREANAEKAGFPEDKGGKDTLALLKNTRLESPFFMFINFYEMHWPYSKTNLHRYLTSLERRYRGQGPDIYRIIEGRDIPEEDKRSIVADYYALSGRVEHLLLSLINILKEKGQYDNTVFVLTSDHGQALFENNFHGHRFLLQDEIIDLPLIVTGLDGFRLERRGEYFNNFDLYKIIRSISSQEPGTEIGSDIIFSESYSGISKYEQEKLRRKKSSNLETIDFLNSPRTAVYKNGSKLVLNFQRGGVEEFKREGKIQDPEASHDVVAKLIKEIEVATGRKV